VGRQEGGGRESRRGGAAVAGPPASAGARPICAPLSDGRSEQGGSEGTAGEEAGDEQEDGEEGGGPMRGSAAVAVAVRAQIVRRKVRVGVRLVLGLHQCLASDLHARGVAHLEHEARVGLTLAVGGPAAAITLGVHVRECAARVYALDPHELRIADTLAVDGPRVAERVRVRRLRLVTISSSSAAITTSFYSGGCSSHRSRCSCCLRNGNRCAACMKGVVRGCGGLFFGLGWVAPLPCVLSSAGTVSVCNSLPNVRRVARNVLLRLRIDIGRWRCARVLGAAPHRQK
jgi:hypothetical protein